MIIDNRQGNNILEGGEHHIAFAVNTEGYNDSGFAGVISRNYWSELANAGECELGTVLTKEVDGVHFYALVCHSLHDGWQNQEAVIMKCFNAIKTDEPIASISIGTGFIGMVQGANFAKIKAGMEKSNKKIILY